MDEQTSNDLHTIVQDPDDLDGHTIEQLADYLDTGRTPPDPSIESSPACRHALAALERLRHLTTTAIDDDPDPDEGTQDDDWVNRVMGQIALDAHAGADFTLPTVNPDIRPVMTEGALRALIRAAGDDQPEFLIGRIRFTGDLSGQRGEVTVSVSATVLHGTVIPTAITRLRDRILHEISRHTGLEQPRIDIVVEDLDQPENGVAA